MKIFGGLDEIIEGISVKISTEFQFIHTDIAVIEDIVVRVLTAQKLKFQLRISSVNVTKSAEKCGFGHIY